MKLLVDDRWFGSTGIGRYAQEILRRAPPGVAVEHLSKTWAIKNPLSPFFLGREINRRCPDLFWSPGFMPPMNSNSPFVVTVHDLIHLKYGSKLQVLYFNEVIRPLLRKTSCVLTVSEYSRNEILTWTNLPPEKVIYVYNAVSDGFCCDGEKYKPGYQYLLYVGNKRAHKNLERLLIAFSKADLSEEIKLVFTGDETRELIELADRLKVLHRIVFLGFVPEARLPAIYRGALSVVLVSLYEGFGIPVIESMACGTPVVTSNISALPEISGDAAYLVDPENIDDISFGLEKIANDSSLREKLVKKGKVRARDFSWDYSADKVWQIFSRV